jgi:hypothetical protein
MNSTISEPRELLSRLQNVRAERDGQWSARCPVHEDRRNSLSVGIASDGTVLLKCHAGCSAADVVAAVGLTLADLFPRSQQGGRRSNGKPRIVATYDYRDECGELVFQVCRMDPKDFRQRKPDGNGGWKWTTKGVRKMLYRLPELVAADPLQPVFVVEGEKDVDRLWSMGLVATCNPGGAGKWKPEYAKTLRGRHVVVIPDNDKAGTDHAADVARSLCGIAASIKVIELPGVPSKGDVSDWLGDDGTAGDLLTLAEETPDREPDDEAPDDAKPRAVVRNLADVQPQSVEWLWASRIPLGKLTLIAGDPGLGKSFLTLDMAARVSIGRGWPDDFDPGQPPGSVVLFSAEDDLADTIRPRLDKAGADASRIIAVQGVRSSDADNGEAGTRHFSLERDLPRLAEVLESNPGVRLVIIDPVSAYCGKVDSHKNTEIRGLLAPLAELAAKHRVAIVAVTHLNKGAGAKALYRATGSLAFVAAARAVWLVAKDADNPARRLLLPVKMNLCPDPTGMAYSIQDGMVCWEADPVELTGDDALAAEFESPGDNDRRGQCDEAAEWLADTLSGCTVLAKEIPKWAKNNGITPATLRRAKETLGVISKRIGFGPESRVWWTLPDA